MIILSKKLFSQEPIDISHLSPAAQKKIIARERKKIELDQKLEDTANSIEKNKQRASMSISDNAKLGAMEMKRNPLASAGSSIGGAVLGSKIAQGAATLVPGLGAGGNEALYMTSRILGSSIAPAITNAAGSVVGAAKGLVAGAVAKRKEKKLMRLTKKRAKLED